jgi:uncharacterized protein YpmB
MMAINMSLFQIILGAIYLIFTRKEKTIKEAHQTAKECLNSAFAADRLNPTKGYFNITKIYFEILINLEY